MSEKETKKENIIKKGRNEKERMKEIKNQERRKKKEKSGMKKKENTEFLRCPSTFQKIKPNSIIENQYRKKIDKYSGTNITKSIKLNWTI